jgi:hypothetical protein
LDDAEQAEIFQRSILPTLFPSGTPSMSPTLVLLAGQPGAGRSRVAGSLIAEHGRGLAFVSGDDMRAFHPRFAEMARSSDAAARDALAKATAGWVRDSIRFARDNSRSVVLEGAFQDPRVAIGMVDRFAGEGFTTRVVVVGSRRAESLLTVASLYLGAVRGGVPARLTTRDAHDRAFEATRTLVATVEEAPSTDRMTVVDRAGRSVFDAHRSDGDRQFVGAQAALEASQTQRLSRFDATQWLSELHHVTDFAAARRDIPAGVTELLVDLHEVALREVIPELHVPGDGKFATAIEQKTVAALVALRRLQPRERTVDAAAPVIAPVGPDLGGISR